MKRERSSQANQEFQTGAGEAGTNGVQLGVDFSRDAKATVTDDWTLEHKDEKATMLNPS